MISQLAHPNLAELRPRFDVGAGNFPSLCVSMFSGSTEAAVSAHGPIKDSMAMFFPGRAELLERRFQSWDGQTFYFSLWDADVNDCTGANRFCELATTAGACLGPQTSFESRKWTSVWFPKGAACKWVDTIFGLAFKDREAHPLRARRVGGLPSGSRAAILCADPFYASVVLTDELLAAQPNAFGQRFEDEAWIATKQRGGVEAQLPRWNKATKTLSFRGVTVIKFKKIAPIQMAILDAFEECGWPSRVDNPLPAKGNSSAIDRRKSGIKKLNRSSNGDIVFSTDGTGEQICWAKK